MSISNALRRRLSAGLLAGMLAVSGGLLTASPALAAEDTLQILTPVPDQEFDSRTVEVTGTGTPGAIVRVTTGTDNPGPGGGLPLEVDLAGTWETTLPFLEESLARQMITVTQTYQGEPAGRLERFIRIPAPVAVFVDAPADGAVVDTRNPVVTGRARNGTTITAIVDGQVLGGTTSEPGGTFTLPLHFGQGAAGTVEVLLEGTDDGGQAVQPVTRTLTIPASLPAPVLTSPVSPVGAGRVVFSGTATPGYEVVVDTVGAEESLEGGDDSTVALVGADGTWTTTEELPAGDYRGYAYLSRPSGSALESSGVESFVLEFALTVETSAVAAPAVPTPASAPRPAAVVAPRPQLAATGASADIAGTAAGILLLLGAGAVVTTRRRAARVR